MPIDYKRYPQQWSDEIVPRILARAKNQCEQCGIPNAAVAYSIPLKVSENGRYKVKRFWVQAESDMLRMKPYSMGGDIKQIKVVLTVAHLDHDETNHNVSDDRLMAMCQYCHLNYDSSEKYRRACLRVASCG